MPETKLPCLVPEGITDVYPHALSFLPLTDIARLSVVSTDWREASNHALPNHVKLFMKRRNQLLSLVEEKLRPKDTDTTEANREGMAKTPSQVYDTAMQSERKEAEVLNDDESSEDEDESTNSNIIEANINHIKTVSRKLTQLFLRTAQDPRLKQSSRYLGMFANEEEGEYYSRQFFNIATEYAELGWQLDDTIHRIAWEPDTGDFFINHELFETTRYGLVDPIASIFPRMSQYGVETLMNEAKKDVVVSKISPFSMFDGSRGLGPDPFDTLVGILRRKKPVVERKNARAFFPVLHKELLDYLLELEAESVTNSEKDNHGQSLTDKVKAMIGLAAMLLHQFEKYASDPRLEKFDIPITHEDISNEAGVHFAGITSTSSELKIVACLSLDGDHQKKVVSFVKDLDLVFNFSFPYLTRFAKRACTDEITKSITNGWTPKKPLKMRSFPVDENGKLLPPTKQKGKKKKRRQRR